MKVKSWFVKSTEWEHWPSFMYYLPLLPYFLYKTWKAKSLTYFSAANPGIKMAGNGTESKYETLMLLPEHYRPVSIYVQAGTSADMVLDQISQSEINYPFILKPDVGFRGYMVKKIDNEKLLKAYINNFDHPLIVQEFVDYPNEMGVFYHRLPNQKRGKITSLTLKKYPTLTGDGRSTLKQLITNDNRAFLYFDLLKNIHHQKLDHIYAKNEIIPLSFIGNHSKGTQFINGNHLIDEALTRVFDNLSHQTSGWYYGRMDLKYNSFADLKEGKNFKILEINGIISEPTHIYDPEHPDAGYFKCIHTIKEHWEIIDKIALINKTKSTVTIPEVKEYLKNLYWLRNYSRKLIRANNLNLDL